MEDISWFSSDEAPAISAGSEVLYPVGVGTMRIVAKNERNQKINLRGRITGLVLETFTFTHDIGFAKIRPDLYKGIFDKDRIISINYRHAIQI